MSPLSDGWLQMTTLVLTETSSQISTKKEAIIRSFPQVKSLHLKPAAKNAWTIVQLVSTCFLFNENQLLLCFRVCGMGLPVREQEVLFEEDESSLEARQPGLILHWLWLRCS